MLIEWLGHSCFKVTLKNGTRILLDSYDDRTGHTLQNVETDIVTISHAHHDHNNLSCVTGDYTVVDKPGVYTFGELTIEGIKTWHDNENGALRGENICFMLTVRGMRLCHMGDIGAIPTDDVIEKLKGAEILLIPVGGKYTIDPCEALQLCEAIEPNIIIPMHFQTAETGHDLAPLSDFLEAAGREYDVSHRGKCYINIDKATLKKRTRIFVMEYL